MTTATIPTIERAPGFKVGTRFFTTLAEAQEESLKALLNPVMDAECIPGFLVAHASEAIAILSPPKELRSRATRRDKGTRRGARAKPTTAPTQVAA